MERKDAFLKLVGRYRTSPEFFSVDIVDPNQPGLTGDTLLHAAVVRGATDDVEILIAAGADVNAVGDLGNTPLHHAASRGHAGIAQKLIECRADRSIKNEFGQTPLDLAVLMKRARLVSILKV